MKPTHDHEEEQNLDALILAALRRQQISDGSLPDLTAPAPPLSQEDQRALDALGTDLVAHILAGLWKPQYRRRHGRPAWQSEPEVTGALQRSPEGSELSELAKEEIEQKIRELGAESDPEKEM